MAIIKNIINTLNLRLLSYVFVFVLLLFHTHFLSENLLIEKFDFFKVIMTVYTAYLVHVIFLSTSKNKSVKESLIAYSIFIAFSFVLTFINDKYFSVGIFSITSWIDILCFSGLLFIIGKVLETSKRINTYYDTDQFKLRLKVLSSIFIITLVAIIFGTAFGQLFLNFILDFIFYVRKKNRKCAG